MGLDTSLNEEYKILSDENILRIINENVTQLKYSQIENPLNDSCAICQDDFNPDDDVCKINSCGHIFKNNLINNWLKEKHSCPVCRYNILTNSNVNRYIIRRNIFFLTEVQFRNFMTANIVNTLMNNTSTNLSFAIVRR